MKWPVSLYNENEHDGCPKNFATRSCACPCGHKGERTLESRGMLKYEVTKPKPKKEQVEEPADTEV
jgi:hypothetical protein